MPALSRRRTLHLAGGVLLSALAGCNGSDSASSSVPRSDRDSIDDVTVLKIRHTAATPMVYENRGDETTTTRSSESARRRGNVMMHVTDPPGEGRGEPVFPADVDGADRLRTFFEETDFETESIYLLQSTVPACSERHLQGVYSDGNGVDAEFCRTLRPADVACEADAWAMTVFAIRLPFPGDGFNSVGGGSSSSCDHPYRDPIEPDTSLVVGPNGGENE